MTPNPNDIAKSAEHLAVGGGASTAVFSVWAWLGQNSNEIMAVCAIIGAVVSMAGFIVSWVYRHKRP